MYTQEYVHLNVGGHLGCLGDFLSRTIINNAVRRSLLLCIYVLTSLDEGLSALQF